MGTFESSPGGSRIERDVTSGFVIGLSAIVSVVMMSHHPSAHGHGTPELLAEAVRLSFATKFVHGALIVTTVALFFGFSGFAARLGLGQPLARLGLVTYAFGSVAMCGAAILNGLVFPELAERYAGRGAQELESIAAVLAWNWEINQALALVGVLAWSAAVLSWSLVLVRRGGAWSWIGGAGILIGAANATVFSTDRLSLDVHGFGLFVLAQSAWSLAVGARMALPAGKARR